MDPFIGQIMMFGGNFAPRGWAKCDGQLLSISGNTALFSILGTTFGGDGRTTFGLPDLRGRMPMNWGTGPGLSARNIGQKSGAETVTLSTSQIPSHVHGVNATGKRGTAEMPTSNWIAGHSNAFVPAQTTPQVQMAGDMIRPTGGGGSHDNMSPFLCVTFCIALVGVFPSRN